MFNDTSIIKEVNILNKVICYLLILLSIIICKDLVLLLIFDIFLLLVTKEYKNLFRFNILLTVLIILNIFFPHFLWIIKIFMLVIYTILLKKVTKLVELRYVIEVTFYRFQTKKITYRIFYMIYFLKSFNKNFKRMLLLKDDYEMKIDIKFLIFIIRQSYIKAKLTKEEFLEINNMRFYNYSGNRTYMEKNTWESWDTTYLVCHVLITLIIFIYGR